MSPTRAKSWVSLAGQLGIMTALIACGSSTNFAEKQGGGLTGVNGGTSGDLTTTKPDAPASIDDSKKDGSGADPKGVDADAAKKATSDTKGVTVEEQKKIDSLPPPPPPALIPMGMLVNDLHCALCHWQIRGDVSSTSTVTEPYPSSIATVFGNWKAAKDWQMPKEVKVTGLLEKNFVGAPLPKNQAFPDLDVAGVESKMQGFVVSDANGVKVDKVINGNLILIGTADKPIRVVRDILVKGDLVIKGVYRGKGTIYVTGNIYIPADLKALRTAFPFPDDVGLADAQGKKLAADADVDALGLATQQAILMSDLDSGIYEHELTPAASKRAALNVDRVYTWYPNGKNGYNTLYENSYNCHSKAFEAHRSANMVEAILYSKKTIAGVSRSGSFMLRGGVIADNLHIIAGAGNHENTENCPADVSPVHGRPQNNNYIDYDYRMRNGLQVLEQLQPFFYEAK